MMHMLTLVFACARFWGRGAIFCSQRLNATPLGALSLLLNTAVWSGLGVNMVRLTLWHAPHIRLGNQRRRLHVVEQLAHNHRLLLAKPAAWEWGHDVVLKEPLLPPVELC
eukprot:4943128-Amphidinium_carterae.3